MNINLLIIFVFLAGFFLLINFNHEVSKMFISTSSSSINNHLIKRRSTRHLISKTMNVTDNNNITSTTNRIRLFDIANSYNAMKYLSSNAFAFRHKNH